MASVSPTVRLYGSSRSLARAMSRHSVGSPYTSWAMAARLSPDCTTYWLPSSSALVGVVPVSPSPSAVASSSGSSSCDGCGGRGFGASMPPPSSFWLPPSWLLPSFWSPASTAATSASSAATSDSSLAISARCSSNLVWADASPPNVVPSQNASASASSRTTTRPQRIWVPRYGSSVKSDSSLISGHCPRDVSVGQPTPPGRPCPLGHVSRSPGGRIVGVVSGRRGCSGRRGSRVLTHERDRPVRDQVGVVVQRGDVKAALEPDLFAARRGDTVEEDAAVARRDRVVGAGRQHQDRRGDLVEGGAHLVLQSEQRRGRAQWYTVVG